MINQLIQEITDGLIERKIMVGRSKRLQRITTKVALSSLKTKYQKFLLSFKSL